MEPRSRQFTAPTLDGIQLHTLEWGESGRPALILLHGGGANAHWWCHIAPAFCDRFHVIALDFRGHGASDYPTELQNGAFARDLEALSHRVAPGPVVVGHSMGGLVALEFASRSDRLAGLALVDVPYRSSASRGRRSSRLALRMRRSYATRQEAIARFQFLPPSRRAAPDLREFIAIHSTRREADGRFAYNFDPRWFGVRSGSKPEIERIGCPVLLIRGEESEFLEPEDAERFQQRISNTRLLEIPEAGHHVHLDQPERFVEGLGEFLHECFPTSATSM